MNATRHHEDHAVHRVGWLRAAVLGANDGILSTASIVVGVAVAGSARADILLAGLAGAVAGAMSMAAGEYVSVSSQADAERSDMEREARELRDMPEDELEELTAIYQGRGLDRDLAERVATQLTERDALAAHARDELGISEVTTARPLQAALVSAATFIAGAAAPVLVAALAPRDVLAVTVALATLVALAALGGLGARAGGANLMRGALRVCFWGVLAMAATAAIGAMFNLALT